MAIAAADKETGDLILRVVGRTEKGYLSNEDIKSFPCTDLKTIDRLWLKYSNDRHGFSIQKQIFYAIGGKPNQVYDQRLWEKFIFQVGWFDDYAGMTNFSFATSPKGHLPISKGVTKTWDAVSKFVTRCNP